MEYHHDCLKGNLLNHLPKVRGKYTTQVDLAKSVWFRVGGPAEVVFKPADIHDLAFFLRTRPRGVPFIPIGVGSNLLIRDAGIPGVVIRLGRGFNNVFFKDTFVDVGAALLDRSLAMMACAEGLSGFEFLAGIPGTIGGALRMNAGCYGREIKDCLVAAFALDQDGTFHTLTPEDMGLSYRHCGIPEDWIFVGARFKGQKGNPAEIEARIRALLAEREETQPVHMRTGGSTFANPENNSAWKLIDQAGCRGLTYGGAQMSEKHCNFMINTGQATAADLETLGLIVQERVFQTSGILLRWEIKRIGQAREDLLTPRKVA